MEPMMFNIAAEDDFKYLVVTAEPGSIQATSDFLKKSWKEIAPDDPYRGFFRMRFLKNMFKSNRSNNKICILFPVVALFAFPAWAFTDLLLTT